MPSKFSLYEEKKIELNRDCGDSLATKKHLMLGCSILLFKIGATKGGK